MAVIDEIYIKDADNNRLPIDSYDNTTIDVINIDGESYHFAKENSVAGTNKIVCNDVVAEPLINCVISGNSLQDGTPTPDAPVEIVSVGDKSVNLLEDARDIYNGGGSNKAHSYAEVIEDGRECIKFTSASGVTYDKIKFKENTQYTFSFDCKDFVHESDFTGSYDIPLGIWYTDGNRKLITIPKNSDWTKLILVSAANKTISHIGIISFTSYTTMYIDINTFQIQEGSTATPYEPYYDGYKIPVVQRGINLFNKDNLSLLSGKWNVKSIVATDTGVLITPNAIGNDNGITRGYCYVMIGLASNYSGKTITLTSPVSYSNATKPQIFDASGKTMIKQGNNFTLRNGLYYSSISIAENTYTDEILVLRLYYDIKDTTITEFEFKELMVVESADVISYEPYFKQITNIFLDEPLRKLGDYADCIDFKENKVVRNISEKLFDGSENWIYEVITGGNNFYTYIPDAYGNRYLPVLCNMGKYYNGALEKIYSCRISESSNNFNFRYGDYDNLTDFKNKLAEMYNSNNPLTINYILKEPTEEPLNIDLPQLPAQTTIVEIDTQLAPDSFNIDYWKQIRG